MQQSDIVTTFIRRCAATLGWAAQTTGNPVLMFTFEGTARRAFAGGRRNVALRNRFYDCATMEHEGTLQQCCGACIVLDNRGMNWQHIDCNTTLPVRVKELLYPSSPWASRYPELANITADRECKPAYCKVADNTYSGGSFLRGMVMGQFPADWEVAWRDVVENNTAV